MAYTDVQNKVSQIKLNNLALLSAKLRQGDGGSPYTAPPKDDPNRKYVPSPTKKEVANLTPKMFTPFDMNLRDEDDGIINHIITPAIHDTQMEHFKRFIENTGDSTWDLVNSGNTDMMIAKLPHTPPTEKMVIGNKLEDSPLRFRSDADRIRLMEDYAKGFRYDGT